MRTLLQLVVFAVTAALAACSVHGVTFTEPLVTIGGTITGLDGTGLVLTNNGLDDLMISGNGAFAFTTPLSHGASYAIGLKSQPSSPMQMCSVMNGSGIAGDENVTDVQVICRTTAFSIGGTVTGLAGSGLMLQDNGGDNLPVSADGAFTFATPLSSGASYAVTVAMQPSQPTQACTVINGTGTVSASNVMNVQVTCVTSTFTIGGMVTGLLGSGLVLQDNAGDDLAIGGDGSFTFATPIASGSTFAVTVRTQPALPSQSCTVSGGVGVVAASDITNVQVTCTTNAFTIGGTVSGLTGTGLVLQDNGGADLPIPGNGNGAFTFATPVASGATYSVTVKAQPSGQTCTVANGTGTVGASNVTNIQVTCDSQDWSPSLFPIAVPGGIGAGDIALDNNGDLLVVALSVGAIRRVNHVTGAQTTVATGIANDLRGVTYRSANDTIYANTFFSGQIFAVTPPGAVSPLATVSELNAITIAPPSFGSFGGFIIGVTQLGSVVAVNPANAAVTTITAAAGPASDLAFAPDGTLYISGGTTVSTVTAAGVVTQFVGGLGSADGITITPDGARMFIADSATDTVRQVTIPGAVVTTIGPADINAGFAVGGILAAPGNTLIVMTGSSSQTLIAFTY